MPAVGVRMRAVALLALLAAAALASWTGCDAQPELQAAEYKVKAAFLYKFAGYVQWPRQAFESAEAPFVIGILGADLLANELAQLVQSHLIQGRSVEVRRLRRDDPLTGLHMLFVGRSDSAALESVLAPVKGKPVLKVTEADGGLPDGSIINLVVVEDKVRFDIALREAEACQLKVSARLLSIARKVV